MKWFVVIGMIGLSGCAGTAAIGPALSAKQQLLQEILTAPTAVCAAVLMQETQNLAQLKAQLSQPTQPLFSR